MTRNEVQSILKTSFGSHLTIESIVPLGGGCINNAQKIITNGNSYFVKFNTRVLPDFFEVEFKSLKILREYFPGSVPEPVEFGNFKEGHFLLTSFIESSARKSHYWQKLGEYLAVLHAASSDQFGLSFDNYIGSLPQENMFKSSWVHFFVEQRLKFQIELAKRKNLIDSNSLNRFELLFEKLPGMMPEEKPALIHGDLWSGNLMTDEKGLPAIIDPAIYFGHREIELAFTQLFGGFDPSFIDAYHENSPLERGFHERIDLYNLYPLLVHLNLFGTSYLSGIQRILSRFL